MVTLENKYNSLDDKQKQELNDYMWYAINALNYVWVEAAFNPVKNGMKDILEYDQLLTRWVLKLYHY
jgi:hypothetical protein